MALETAKREEKVSVAVNNRSLLANTAKYLNLRKEKKIIKKNLQVMHLAITTYTIKQELIAKAG